MQDVCRNTEITTFSVNYYGIVFIINTETNEDKIIISSVVKQEGSLKKFPLLLAAKIIKDVDEKTGNHGKFPITMDAFLRRFIRSRSS